MVRSFKNFTYWLEGKKQGLKKMKAQQDKYFTISQVQNVFNYKLFLTLT